MNQKRKIKVLVLINSLALAGAERLLLQIAEHVDKDKFDFVVCYLEKEKSLLDEFKQLRIKTIGLEINHKLDLRVIPRLYKTLKNEKPDILHIHLPCAGIIGRIIGRFAKVPVIISTQHNVASSFKKNLLLFEKLTFPLANVITYVSEGVEQSFFDQSNVFFIEVYNNKLEDRLSIKKRNSQRLYQVYQQFLKNFKNDLIKTCPSCFIEIYFKFLFYKFFSLINK